MNGLFNPENPVISAINTVVDILVLGLLWLVCSIPIITIGASTTALCYAYKKAIYEKDSYATKAFFDSFKMNFKQATILWLMIAVILAVCAFDYHAARTMVDEMNFMSVPIVIVTVIFMLVLMWSLYVFPYLARFENTTKIIMKNCALIMIANFQWTILLVGLFAVAVLFFPLFLCVSVSVYIVFANRIHEHVFSKYIKGEESEGEKNANS